MSEPNILESNIYQALISQYHAALKMMRAAIDKCPESLWLDSSHPNRFWHIAYHALFYTHFYLHPSETEFTPWAHHKKNYQHLDPLRVKVEERQKIDAPYSKVEILKFHEVCLQEVQERVHSIGLNTPSGFSWLQFNRMELHVYNIRHLQHHAGQLIDRLRTAEKIGVQWVRSG